MNLNVLVVDALKWKAINRYKSFLKRVKKGYQDDYHEILDLISFINLPTKLDNHEFIKQKLLNNGDTIYLHFGK